MAIAHLCRFYGWKPDDCYDLTDSEIHQFIESSKVLEAREKISMFEAVLLANCDKTARNKILNKLNKVAFPKFTKDYATDEELFKWLNK